MKKINLVFVVCVFLLSLVSAQQIFKQGELIDLKVPCSYNGSFCASTASCNITVMYPNGTILMDIIEMTNTGNGMPRVTITDNIVLGEFTYFTTCCQTSDCDDYRGEFEVTTTGESDRYIVPLFLLLSSMAFLILGISTKNTIIGFFSGILFILSGTYMMIYGFGDVANMYSRGIAGVSLGFGLIVLILSGIESISKEEYGDEE